MLDMWLFKHQAVKDIQPYLLNKQRLVALVKRDKSCNHLKQNINLNKILVVLPCTATEQIPFEEKRC